MHSQIHRGISLIILPLPSERDGERLLFPHSVLSNTSGNLANCSPSPFGEGRGEAPFYPPLPSERVGERLHRVCFRLLLLCTIREGSVHIAPLSPPINEKGGRASLRDLHRNLVSNYYKIVISKVGFLSFQTLSLSRQSLCLQQRERCCASAESLNSLGIVHHIIDT